MDCGLHGQKNEKMQTAFSTISRRLWDCAGDIYSFSVLLWNEFSCTLGRALDLDTFLDEYYWKLPSSADLHSLQRLCKELGLFVCVVLLLLLFSEGRGNRVNCTH